MLLCSNVALANPYVGIGLQDMDIKLNSPELVRSNEYYENKFMDFALVAGYKFNKHSIEVSYFNNSEDKSNNSTGLVFISDGVPLTTKTNLDLSIINLDLLSTHYEHNNISAFSLLGVSYITADLKEDYLGNGISRELLTEEEKEIGFNVGGGGQYNLNDNVLVQLDLKYTHMNSLKFDEVAGIKEIDNIVSTNIGIKYLF